MIYIGLKVDDKMDFNKNTANTDEDRELSELITTPSSDKCNKRKKTLKKDFLNCKKYQRKKHCTTH